VGGCLVAGQGQPTAIGLKNLINHDHRFKSSRVTYEVISITHLFTSSFVESCRMYTGIHSGQMKITLANQKVYSLLSYA